MVSSLFLENLYQQKRRQMILKSLKEGQSLYEIEEDDIEFMKKIIINKQYALISFREVDSVEVGGGLMPLAIVHDEKKTEVEDLNQELNKRLHEAIK